jgi:replicative superfamily II helicase
VLEEEFRRKDTKLRVLVATTTLAMGVNTPASAVVIVGLTHPPPGNVPYTVAEYKNMVGRAGRLGHAERGESYVICSRGLDEHRVWASYVLGKPEDIKSVFLNQTTDPRTQVLRTLAALEPGADGSVDAHLLVSFLESTFGAFQQRQINPAWNWGRDNIVAMLREMGGHQLI